MFAIPPRPRVLVLSILSAFLALPNSAWSAEETAAASQPAPARSEARLGFIKNFQRIGLNTTPGDAMLLRILVATCGSKRGVEVGAATGFGAINMGLAFERNGGHLTTIDIDPKMVATTRRNLEQVQLQDTVTVVEGDALEVLPRLEGEYDFLFLDAVKKDYLRYFQAMQPKMPAGALIVADNVIRSASAMRDFLDFVAQSPDYEMVIVQASEEKGDGMAIIYKLR